MGALVTSVEVLALSRGDEASANSEYMNWQKERGQRGPGALARQE